MYFVSFRSRFIDRFAPCVLFRRAMWAHQFMVTLTCTNGNETVAIDVLVVVYNKTWENRVMLSLHGQLVLDIRPRCWLRMLKLTRLRLVNFYHPQSTSLPNIQHYLIMTRWITLQYSCHHITLQRFLRCHCKCIELKWKLIFWLVFYAMNIKQRMQVREWMHKQHSRQCKYTKYNVALLVLHNFLKCFPLWPGDEQ